SSRESGNYQIVGANPVISPVPLAALDNYRLVHSSDILVAVPGGATLPEVKVFEYIGTGSRVVD
ncbi:MAG: hypothetical protein U1B77_01790, partial [Dehalococcoidales bacterium]|nr:hypothetical protein [Dehalococcoidales bacterium]